MKKNVHVFRGARRRDVNKPEADTVASEIDDERPLEIAVAIATHLRHGRPDVFQVKEQARIAEIAEMPDLVRALGQRIEIGWEMIMGVGKDENPQCSRDHPVAP